VLFLATLLALLIVLDIAGGGEYERRGYVKATVGAHSITIGVCSSGYAGRQVVRSVAFT